MASFISSQCVPLFPSSLVCVLVDALSLSFPCPISALALWARCPQVPLRLSSSSLSTCRLPSHLSQHIILFLGRHPHLANAILVTPCIKPTISHVAREAS